MARVEVFVGETTILIDNVEEGEWPGWDLWVEWVAEMGPTYVSPHLVVSLVWIDIEG